MRKNIQEILGMIDHAALQPKMSQEEIRKEIELAMQYNVASVCVHPSAISMAAKLLKDHEVKVGTVVGFPQGMTFPEVKRAETVRAVAEGASEIDMVLHIGRALSGEWNYVSDDISAVAEVCGRHDVLLKVILETDFLNTEAMIKKASAICREAGAQFVKTSTGFGFQKDSDGQYRTKGALESHIHWMREAVGPDFGVKASGGIRTRSDAEKMIKAGANRLGTSATAIIAS